MSCRISAGKQLFDGSFAAAYRGLYRHFGFIPEHNSTTTKIAVRLACGECPVLTGYPLSPKDARERAFARFQSTTKGSLIAVHAGPLLR